MIRAGDGLPAVAQPYAHALAAGSRGSAREVARARWRSGQARPAGSHRVAAACSTSSGVTAPNPPLRASATATWTTRMTSRREPRRPLLASLVEAVHRDRCDDFVVLVDQFWIISPATARTLVTVSAGSVP